MGIAYAQLLDSRVEKVTNSEISPSLGHFHIAKKAHDWVLSEVILRIQAFLTGHSLNCPICLLDVSQSLSLPNQTLPFHDTFFKSTMQRGYPIGVDECHIISTNMTITFFTY